MLKTQIYWLLSLTNIHYFNYMDNAGLNGYPHPLRL
jgi:hypothetical protein